MAVYLAWRYLWRSRVVIDRSLETFKMDPWIFRHQPPRATRMQAPTSLLRATWGRRRAGRRELRLALALLGSVGCVDCSRQQEAPTTQPIVAAESAPYPSPTTAPSALVGLPWLLQLSNDVSLQDVVTPPQGAAERRPIVVAVHGAGDRPNWACGGWRIGVESYAFVTCPMGLPMGAARYGWGSARDIAVAVERALTALRQRFPEHLVLAPMVYAGFSQGANLAAPYLIENAQRFPFVALAEGGYSYVTDPEFARKYHAAGGKRVLLLCGTAGCMITAKQAKRVLERAGLQAFVAGDPTSGHNLNVPMQNALRRDWPQLVDGLEGWGSYVQHRW